MNVSVQNETSSRIDLQKRCVRCVDTCYK